MTVDPGGELAVLTFALAGERCALAADDVREVVRAALPVRLPKAPDIIAGVLDVRGELVPLLALRRRFGLPPRLLAPDDHIVVARVGHRVVAFAVERALELARVPAALVDAPAAAASGVEHVAGLARLADGPLLIYDLRAFLTADEALGLDRALAQAGS